MSKIYKVLIQFNIKITNNSMKKWTKGDVSGGSVAKSPLLSKGCGSNTSSKK